MELRKDTQFEKYLHDKPQNANESFNGTIWGRIPKNTSNTLLDLEIGVYDAVAHFNTRIKVSVLIYEKHNFAPGVYILKDCKKHNLKTANLANQRACPKNKLRRPNLWAKKMSENDKLLEKEVYLHVLGTF